MTFAHPYLLLLLLLLPLAAWLKGRRGSSPAFVYSSVQLVEGLTSVTPFARGCILAALRWLALAVFIVALAQPRLAKSTTEVKASGIDIVAALDLSGSMISEDFVVKGGRVNRVNMAKSVLKDFIDRRPNDRIGLVVFAAQAFIAAPLTLDHDYLQDNLARLDIGTINSDATAIGDALATALNQLRAVKSKSKIIILATDGQNNSGKIDPLTAADAAAALGVKIYTVGIGEQGQAPMPARDVFGRKGVSNDAGGRGRRHAANKSRTRPAANIIAPTTRKSSGRFTRKLTGWKRPRRPSTNTRSSRSCFRGWSAPDWRCCCWKLRWDKPC